MQVKCSYKTNFSSEDTFPVSNINLLKNNFTY